MFNPQWAYEMTAPDGTTIYRVPQRRSGWWAAQYRGKFFPILGGIRGPLWLSIAWSDRATRELYHPQKETL
jgi:expansin (peptidoglycan-binding protein)